MTELALLNNNRLGHRQEALIGGFLISLHAAVGRRFALSLAPVMANAGDVALHLEIAREFEIVGLLAHLIGWRLFALDPLLAAKWETAWLPLGVPGGSQRSVFLDSAALGHAAHSAIRPAAALPAGIDPTDPFAMALRQIEFESGRMLQAQMAILKSEGMRSSRDAVEDVVARRHRQVKDLWAEVLEGAAQVAS